MQMPEPFDSWWIKAIAFTAFAIIAGFLGHMMRTFDKGEKFSWTITTIKTLGAGLTGFLMYLLCIALNFNDIWSGIIVGVFGWLGADTTISVLKGFVYNMMKIDKNEVQKDESSNRRDLD